MDFIFEHSRHIFTRLRYGIFKLKWKCYDKNDLKSTSARFASSVKKCNFVIEIPAPTLKGRCEFVNKLDKKLLKKIGRRKVSLYPTNLSRGGGVDYKC